MFLRLSRFLAFSALVLPTAASAHVGLGEPHSFLQGFAHPTSGLDHILAMIAVGLYAVRLGGRAMWLVPMAFVGTMAISGPGLAGFEVPFVEIGIALSIVVLGLAIYIRLNLSTLAAIAVVGLFAIFHGQAHWAEIPDGAGGLGFAAGFILATSLLHAT